MRVRFAIGLFSVVGLVAQTVPVQPIPTQVPPVRPEPIPTQIPSAPLIPFPDPTAGVNATPRIRPTPVILHKVEPKYTAEARAAGLQGVVSLYVELGSDDTPKEVRVMEGLGLGLDEAAVEAVKQWKWEPLNWHIMEVAIPFRLDSPAPWTVNGEWYRFTIPHREKFGEIARPVPIAYVAPNGDACREAGTATIRLTIASDGKPLDVRADDPVGNSLTSAAVKAVEAWRFHPAEGNGRKLEAQGSVEFSCRPLAAGEKPAARDPEYRVGRGVSPPVLLTKIEPEYSEQARRAKLQGLTTLYVQITPEGKPAQIHIIDGLGMGLDQKAMEAVKHWRFRPGMKGGKPVTVEATIRVNFRLQ